MNYQEEIAKILEALKADKSIVQPWRNKAAARLEESQAFVNMGKSTTLQKPPADLPVEPSRPPMKFAGPKQCICQPDMPPRKDCPVHGKA